MHILKEKIQTLLVVLIHNTSILLRCARLCTQRAGAHFQTSVAVCTVNILL
jgi:hypothetical protein